MVEKSGGNGELHSDANKTGQPELNKDATPPTDFKICEVWIKNNQVYLEGTKEFWMDKVRALGLLELCRDIIKTAQMPEEKKIITSPTMSPVDFVRSRFGKRKR